MLSKIHWKQTGNSSCTQHLPVFRKSHARQWSVYFLSKCRQHIVGVKMWYWSCSQLAWHSFNTGTFPSSVRCKQRFCLYVCSDNIRYFICPSEYGLKVNYSELHITQLHLIHSLVSPFPAELIGRIQGRNVLPLSYMVCLLSFLLTTVLITLLLISGYLCDHRSLRSFF